MMLKRKQESYAYKQDGKRRSDGHKIDVVERKYSIVTPITMHSQYCFGLFGIYGAMVRYIAWVIRVLYFWILEPGLL